MLPRSCVKRDIQTEQKPILFEREKRAFFPRTKKVIKLGLKLYGHLRAFRKTRVMHIVYSKLCIIQQKHMCMRPLMLIYFHCVKKASRWFIWGVIFLHMLRSTSLLVYIADVSIDISLVVSSWVYLGTISFNQICQLAITMDR